MCSTWNFDRFFVYHKFFVPISSGSQLIGEIFGSPLCRVKSMDMINLFVPFGILSMSSLGLKTGYPPLCFVLYNHGACNIPKYRYK